MGEEDLVRRIAQLHDELRSLRAVAEVPYCSVVEDMSELVVRWKPDGTRMFVNDAYCRLFGVSYAELIGTPFWALISEEDRERVKQRIAALSPQAPVSTGCHRAIGRSGDVIWMEWVDRALFDDEGNVVELQSVGRDITERMRLEEQARRVENADAVARISAAIAHDLNNLLAVLYMELIALESRTGNNPEIHGMVQAMDNIRNLVRQLGQLRFGVVLKPQPVNVNSSVEQLFGLLEKVAGDRVVLKRSLWEAPCAILGDATQIDQVLLNLVRNAAEALPGGGEVCIATRVENGPPGVTPARAHVVLEVSDTGGGIAPEILPRMFEPSVTTKATGQGLGLATVKSIVDGHGGSVRLESSPRGTRFEVWLPLATTSERS